MTRISLGQNLSSLSAQRGLAKASVQLSQTYQRLSSGLRINRASDDAAGLAISSALSVSARVFGRGIQNINDGISLLAIADGVIANLSDIVIRLKELAEQAANGTYSSVQRKALDNEAQTLRKEYQRLVQSTTFNSANLLNGTLGSVRLQAGFGENGGIVSTLGGAIGTGTFSQLSGYLGNHYQTKAAVGDINRDGIPDEVVNSGGRCQILLGNGNGTFQTPVSYIGGGGTADLRLGDMNNDGLLDIVTAQGGYVYVLLGNGDGGFSAQKSYGAMGSSAGDVLIGDVNNDGNLDVLQTHGASPFSQIELFLGAGDGTLSASRTLGTSLSTSYGIALADFNGDGNVDLIESGSDGTSGAIAVRLGNGNGTFKSAISSIGESGAMYYRVTAGDLNGDGRVDLVTNDGATGVLALLGNGDGLFEIQGAFDAGISFDSFVASVLGDLNGDGFTDLVVHDGVYVSSMLGNGKGAFTPNQVFDAGLGSEFTDIALADLDSDGVLDLVTAGYSTNTEVKNYKGSTTSGTAPLLEFSLGTKAGALQAFGMLSAKLKQLSGQRGIIGAFQSRLSSVLNVTEYTQSEYLGAESRIKDADIAAEAANLVKIGIVQQAASAILGQANQQSEISLKLLGM